MGTSGNRKGYKMFSFDTSVRNPRRNRQFLEILTDFDGKILDKENKLLIYRESIRKGIYHVTRLPASVKEKYLRGELLTDEEIALCRKLNPQMTEDEGRARTHIIALRYLGFVNFYGKKRTPKIEITPLGKLLLDNKISVEDIYTKALIGLHYSSIQRDSVDNQARPFLNTLFVIKSINEISGDNKGIKKDEFSVFVLTMKDCNYKLAVKEILKYRKYMEGIAKNKLSKTELEKKSFAYFWSYMRNNGILPVSKSTIRDYYDDVYRKFEMTGLVIRSGMKENTYIRFNKFNIEKVNSLIDYYKNYKYETFISDEQYTKFLTEIHIPREISDEVKKRIIDDKIKYLEKGISESDEDKLEFEKLKSEELNLDEKLKKLDILHYRDLFAKKVQEISINEIIRELIIISRNNNEESKYDGIDEWLRLERFTALITAKVYGSKYVKPNLTLDEDGVPKSGAPAGTPDINFETESLYCLLEVTTHKNAKQQENNETTSISRHLRNLETKKYKCSYMIAPIIHEDIVDYFQTRSKIDSTTMLALSIEYYIKTVLENNTVDNFESITKSLYKKMSKAKPNVYRDEINKFRIQ